MPNVKLKNYLHLHFIVFIWGFTAVLGALITIDAIPLVWYRMLMASGFIFIFIYIRKIPLKIPKRVLFGFLFAGLLIALHWLTFFKAIKVSNVSITLAMMSTGAFFTAIMEPFFYKRKVIWYELFFGLVVIFGLLIIFNIEADHTLGIIYGLISAFLSAVFSIINGKFAKEHNASVISFYELLGGMGFISIYLALNGDFSIDLFKLPAMDWVWLVMLASVCTAYAFIASVAVMKYLSPYTVMLTINLEPVYGILLAFVVFGEKEQMSHEFYLGAVIILLTVIANGIVKNSKRLKSTLS
ncbi:DMT family transporter [Sungkyunkwania multivorans]|uniref:DMT family transporter n=1 Tax=Sungkyunkwania multivorans TaxID=1173618 RepID=A0ABW3CVP2_9FLAO